MKNQFLTLCIVLLPILSCSKKASVSNNIIGKWNAIVMTAIDADNGLPLDLIALGESMSLEFQECGTDGLCPVDVILSLDGDLELFEPYYILNENGESMVIPITFEAEIEIIQLNSSELIIRTPTFIYGNDLYVELQKV